MATGKVLMFQRRAIPSKHQRILAMHDSGFHHAADENCTLLSHYAVSSGNSLPTFWDNPSVLNVREELPLLAA